VKIKNPFKADSSLNQQELYLQSSVDLCLPEGGNPFLAEVSGFPTLLKLSNPSSRARSDYKIKCFTIFLAGNFKVMNRVAGGINQTFLV